MRIHIIWLDYNVYSGWVNKITKMTNLLWNQLKSTKQKKNCMFLIVHKKGNGRPDSRTKVV